MPTGRRAGWRVALLTDLAVHHQGGSDTAGSRSRRVPMHGHPLNGSRLR